MLLEPIENPRTDGEFNHQSSRTQLAFGSVLALNWSRGLTRCEVEHEVEE